MEAIRKEMILDGITYEEWLGMKMLEANMASGSHAR